MSRRAPLARQQVIAALVAAPSVAAAGRALRIDDRRFRRIMKHAGLRRRQVRGVVIVEDRKASMIVITRWDGRA